MDDLEQAKRRLRSDMKTRLKSLDAAGRGEKSRELCARIAAAEFWPSLDAAAAFFPLPEEPDLRPLLSQTLAEGKTLLLPRMDKGALTFHAVENLKQDLLPHAWGMREPSPALPCFDWKAAGRVLILVPGLAFDAEGRRLGRGGGFYDRFLFSLPLSRGLIILGAGFSRQIVDKVPAGEGDFTLHGIVTEEGVRVY